MSDNLRTALATLADQAPAPRPPVDLWRRGRRLRRRAKLTVVAGAALAVAVLGTVAPAVQRASIDPPTSIGSPDGYALPARVPASRYPFRVAVNAAPAGPATLVFQQDDQNLVVVSATGEYRRIRSVRQEFVTRTYIGPAGTDTLLSHDGRYVATSDGIVDLNTGAVRSLGRWARYVAWSPDHQLLLYREDFAYYLYDPGTERYRTLYLGALKTASGATHILPSAAFAPDGAAVALGFGPYVAVVDRESGQVRWLRRTEPAGLAGAAAWSADGTRITIADGTTVRELDARTGEPVGNPHTVDVAGTGRVRIVGQRADGGRLAVVTSDKGDDLAYRDVLLLRPGGGHEVAIRLADSAHSIDIARAYADRAALGGAPPSPGLWPVEPLTYFVVGVVVLVLVPWNRLLYRVFPRRRPRPARPSRLLR